MPRKGFLITTDRWRRLRPLFEVVMKTIFDGFELQVQEPFNLTTSERIEFLRAKLRYDALVLESEVSSCPDDMFPLLSLAIGTKIVIARFNEIASLAQAMNAIAPDDYIICAALLVHTFQESEKRLTHLP